MITVPADVETLAAVRVAISVPLARDNTGDRPALVHHETVGMNVAVVHVAPMVEEEEGEAGVLTVRLRRSRLDSITATLAVQDACMVTWRGVGLRTDQTLLSSRRGSAISLVDSGLRIELYDRPTQQLRSSLHLLFHHNQAFRDKRTTTARILSTIRIRS